MRKEMYLIQLLLILFIVFPAEMTTGQKKRLPLDAHMAEIYKDDLPGLMEKKYIRVLTTVNKTNFFIYKGHFHGYEYSLLKGYQEYLSKRIGRSHLNVVFEFIPVDRDELIPKLIQGYGDIAAAGLTVTEKRKEKVSFTNPYLTGVDEVVVTKKGGFQLANLSDLSGKRVYVRKSSSYYQSLTRLNKKLNKEGRKQVKIIAMQEEIETESILEMVNSGAIPITIADSHIAKAWSHVFENLEIHEQVALRQDAKIAWMVRKKNPRLLDSLNSFLKTHQKGSLLGNIYFKRYYQNVEKLKDPTGSKDLARIRKYKDTIQKYAARYGFDWKLILAMAFQESGLDHSKKSQAGAVGLLQIRPSTAGDKHIDIKDVHKLENNIHAGVKYFNFLKDRYFQAEEIRPRDRVRFALAAYNAGPARIRRVRNLAAEMGLNENRWFRNVELAALRVIGVETVRYVSNVNRYYVLYQTLLAGDQMGKEAQLGYPG